MLVSSTYNRNTKQTPDSTPQAAIKLRENYIIAGFSMKKLNYLTSSTKTPKSTTSTSGLSLVFCSISIVNWPFFKK